MLGCSGFRVLGFWRFEGFVFFEGFWGAQCGGVRASGSENVGFSGGLGVQGLGVWVVGTQRREATGRFFRIFGSGRLKVTGFRFLFWVRVNRIEGVQGSWDSGVLKQHFGLARSEVTRRWAILIHGGSGTFNFRLCKNPPLPPRDSCPPPPKRPREAARLFCVKEKAIYHTLRLGGAQGPRPWPSFFRAYARGHAKRGKQN